MTDLEVQTLRKLSHESLMHSTKSLVQKETEITLKVLFHIQEIERRRLHIERGFSSLHEFCVKYLGYSDGSAARRIQASRLLKELPELDSKIESGEISLSVAAQAHRFFYSEMKTQNKVYSKEQKQDILQSLENKSSREAERELLKISPQFLPNEKLRQVTAEHKELRVILDSDLLQEFEQLRTWLSHKTPNATHQDLIREALKIANHELKKRRLGSEKRVKAETKTFGANEQSSGETNCAEVAKSCEEIKKSAEVAIEASTAELSWKSQTVVGRMPEKRTRSIPMHIKREVWKRDRGCCTYTDSKTERKCGSKVGLEFDHYKIPFAKGGSHSTDNLRLVCRQHNTQSAIHHYGAKMISQWIDLQL
jgi:5-methylcytosine-specific restriction endonuclease McrA